jgi:predicted GNAT family acetyltransferase
MIEPPDAGTMLPRIEQGRVWLWEDGNGAPVHLTATNPPAYGVVRIGPVYTPREQRGHGYARAAVAEVSQRLLDDGHRVCLFTDQDNPTSNRVYAAIGYRPVVDMANLVVTPPVTPRPGPA